MRDPQGWQDDQVILVLPRSLLLSPHSSRRGRIGMRPCSRGRCSRVESPAAPAQADDDVSLVAVQSAPRHTARLPWTWATPQDVWHRRCKACQNLRRPLGIIFPLLPFYRWPESSSDLPKVAQSPWSSWDLNPGQSTLRSSPPHPLPRSDKAGRKPATSGSSFDGSSSGPRLLTRSCAPNFWISSQ